MFALPSVMSDVNGRAKTLGRAAPRRSLSRMHRVLLLVFATKPEPSPAAIRAVSYTAGNIREIDGCSDQGHQDAAFAPYAGRMHLC